MKKYRQFIQDLIARRLNGAVTEAGNSVERPQIMNDGSSKDPYEQWILKNEPDPAGLKAMAIESRSWNYRPMISIITPVFNTREYDLVQCIESVLGQTYDNWELCLADGMSDRPYVIRVIERYAAKDKRIKTAFLPMNLGIAGNSNEAVNIATGDYMALLDHDDMLAPFALHEVVRLLNEDPGLDFIYSDEDKVTEKGERRYEPFFKPDWSPDTFLSYNYICHFSVIRMSLVEKVEGFRVGFEGSQDYDLFLRVVQKTNKIRRIPKILYHWRAVSGSAASELTAKPYAMDSAKRAIKDHLNVQGVDAEVIDGLFPTSYRVKYRIKPDQKVSIIIPTRDKVHLLKQCVTSILEKTDYDNYEIVIVDNQSQERETIEYLDMIRNDPAIKKIKVFFYDNPFNFSAINNYAVRSTDAPCLLFLNNDTEVISSEWLSAMLEFAQRDDVGAVGAKLVYPNETIQHAGVILGVGGVANHSHLDFPRADNGYFGRISVIQNLSAVTGACLMMRRDVLEQVGCFDERFSHAFNDVDLCLKIREKKYLIIYTPYAELYHHESASRGYDLATPERKKRFDREIEMIMGKWKHSIEAGDPYYNPNLNLKRPDFTIQLQSLKT